MSTLSVHIYGDPCLHRASESVGDITDEIRRLVEDMAQTMYASRGIGLAAPQVGVNLRVVTVDVDWVEREGGEENDTRNLQVLINPEIMEESIEDSPLMEGCLSLPGIEGEVYRPVGITVRYMDLDGKTHDKTVEGLESKCYQHEIDHINGKVFTDRMPFVRRKLLAGKLNLLKKKHAAGKFAADVLAESAAAG